MSDLDPLNIVLNPSAALGLGTSGAGAITGYYGTKKTNEANRDIASARNLFEGEEAAKARDFSSTEAEKLRDWQEGQIVRQLGFQERMSSSAVQRRMQDLEQAGINPILAGKFDASSPAGAAGAGSQPATAKANAHGYEAKNQLQGAMNGASSALGLARQVSDIQKVNTETANMKQNIQLKAPGATFAKDADEVYKGSKEVLQDVVPAVTEAVSNSAKAVDRYVNNIKDVSKKSFEGFHNQALDQVKQLQQQSPADYFTGGRYE